MRPGGWKHSEETKAKMSVANKGRIMSLEACQHMSAAHIGRPSGREGCHLSDEQRQRNSIAHLGQVISLEQRAQRSASTLGKPKSEAMRANLSIAQLGEKNSCWKGGEKMSNARHLAKRRTLGFNPLNSWFLGCDAHHINKDDVIHMPHELHNSIYHNQATGQGMAEMNALAGQYLTEDWT